MAYSDPVKRKEYMRSWREKNREKIREKHQEAQRRWRSNPENLEKERARNRERYLQRADKVAAYQAKKVEEDPTWRMLIAAKSRAKRQGIPFLITKDDLEVPEYCPVLGLKLKYGAGPICDESASLDKFIPELGYIPGNVRIISNRANMLKNNMTLFEWEAIGKYLRGEV